MYIFDEKLTTLDYRGFSELSTAISLKAIYRAQYDRDHVENCEFLSLLVSRMSLFESSLFTIKSDYHIWRICQGFKVKAKGPLYIFVANTHIDDLYCDHAVHLKEEADKLFLA